MKTPHQLLPFVLSSLLCIFAGGCLARKEADSCCGLTGTQWSMYFTSASNAVTDTNIWAMFLKQPPVGLAIDTARRFDGITDSEDGHAPPNRVEINVPIYADTYYLTHVIVSFEHASGKITNIYAASIMD